MRVADKVIRPGIALGLAGGLILYYSDGLGWRYSNKGNDDDVHDSSSKESSNDQNYSISSFYDHFEIKRDSQRGESLV